jgi:hypothetical protein
LHCTQQQLENQSCPRHAQAAAVRTETTKPVAASATPPDTRPQFHIPPLLFIRTNPVLLVSTPATHHSSSPVLLVWLLQSSSVHFESWLLAHVGVSWPKLSLNYHCHHCLICTGASAMDRCRRVSRVLVRSVRAGLQGPLRLHRGGVGGGLEIGLAT